MKQAIGPSHRSQLVLILGSSVALGIVLGNFLYPAPSLPARKARPAESPTQVAPSPRPNGSLDDEPVCHNVGPRLTKSEHA